MRCGAVKNQDTLDDRGPPQLPRAACRAAKRLFDVFGNRAGDFASGLAAELTSPKHGCLVGVSHVPPMKFSYRFRISRPALRLKPCAFAVFAAMVVLMHHAPAGAGGGVLTIQSRSARTVKAVAPGGSTVVEPESDPVRVGLYSAEPVGVMLQMWWIAEPRQLCRIFVPWDRTVRCYRRQSHQLSFPRLSNRLCRGTGGLAPARQRPLPFEFL
jgi:hypothetical protein